MNYYLRAPLITTVRNVKVAKNIWPHQNLFYIRKFSSQSPFGICSPRHLRRLGSHGDISTQANSTLLPEHEDFFRYTSGRWLWDEERQLRERYRFFNVKELQTISAKCVGSDSCVSMVKLAEGGFNKVFRLIMDDGKVVIVRIPNPNAGPAFYTTASEVATMELVSLRSMFLKVVFKEKLMLSNSRLEPCWIFQCLEYMHGVQVLTIQLVRNISSWKRLQEYNSRTCGRNSLLPRNSRL